MIATRKAAVMSVHSGQNNFLEHKASTEVLENDTLFYGLSPAATSAFVFPQSSRRNHGPNPSSSLFAALCLRLVILPMVAALAFSLDETDSSFETGFEFDGELISPSTTIESESPRTPESREHIITSTPRTHEQPGSSPGKALRRRSAFYSLVNRYDRMPSIPAVSQPRSVSTPVIPFGLESPPVEHPPTFPVTHGSIDQQESLQRQEQVRNDLGIKSIPSGYAYTRFKTGNAFRLLTLSPSCDAQGRMACKLIDYEMRSLARPPYRALSYHWGHTTDRKEITINDKPAYVTANLHSALQTLQEINDSRALWIDALCINQADPNERNHQVSQMRDIFGNAEEVVAWIGPAAGDSERIISTMKLGWEEVNTGSSTLDRASGEYERYSATLRQANCDFFDRPYWTRAWIIQELVVAKSIVLMCGRDTAQWSDFESYVMEFRLHGSKVMGRLPEQLRKVINERMKLLMLKDSYEEQQHDLLALISASASALATDPRDKIFALLGLVGRGHALKIEPDYTLSPCAVYCKAIRSMFRDEHAGDQQMEQKHEAKRLMNYFRKQSAHNPFDRQISQKSQDCDGVGCGSQKLCFQMPGLLGKNGIHVPTKFYQKQLFARTRRLDGEFLQM